VLVKESGEFDRVNKIRDHRVFPDELAASPERLIYHVPSSTARELVRTGALNEAGAAVWSLWDGYLAMPSGKAMRSLLASHNISLTSIHTSGHASVPDLRRLVAAINPGRVVPVHSEATDRFSELFANVEHHVDGEWWSLEPFGNGDFNRRLVCPA
jgi:ribonuclease J